MPSTKTPRSILNLPNTITMARVALIPAIVGVLFLPHHVADQATRNQLATAVFIVAALTDWLDGYLARKLDQQSAFGAFLDPVADKLMVCGALVVLVELGRADALVAFIIISREIVISALREWMARIGQTGSVAVNMLGKVKTTVQMAAIPFLLFDAVLFGFFNTRLWGTVLLWIAAGLTLWSMCYYLLKAWPALKKSE